MRPLIQLRPLHAAQAQIRAEARRFNVLSCGRRFGKTEFGLDEAITGPMGLLQGYPVGWFAPNTGYFEEAWEAAVQVLAPITARKQDQRKRLRLVNGALFECWDLEDVNSGRSRKYGKVIVDEAAIVPKLEQAWQRAILPTLLDYGGNAWFLSSPQGFNFFKTLHDFGNAKHPKARQEWKSWTFSTRANPFIAEAEIEELSREMPELVRRQEIEGEFIDLAGASVRREWIKYADFPRHQRHTIAIGVDLAISMRDSAAYTAIVVLARMADGRVFVLAVRRFKKPFNEILAEIVRMAEAWEPAVVGIESVQFQAAVVQELLRTTKLPVRGVTVQADKLTRFLPVLARYEQGQVFHVPGLAPEFEEELFAFPSGDFKDQVDALGLAFSCCPDPQGGGSIVGIGERADFATARDFFEEDLEGRGMMFPDEDGWRSQI